MSLAPPEPVTYVIPGMMVELILPCLSICPAASEPRHCVVAAAHEDAHHVQDVGEHLARGEVAEGEHEGLGRAAADSRPCPVSAMISMSTPARLSS